MERSRNRETNIELFKNNLKLVRYVINKCYKNTNFDKDDLYQTGCIGLWKAIKNFDESKGYTLSTYAVSLIWGEIKRYTTKNENILKIPASIQSLFVKIVRLKDTYKIDDNISLKTLSELLNVSEYEIMLAIYSNQEIISLSESVNSDNNVKNELLDIIPSLSPSIEEIIIKKERDNIIHNEINKLDETERKIIELSYGINCERKTQHEISKHLKISRAKLCYTKNRAIHELKYRLTKKI
ncbi:MAG: sigma-70 family RNA polymerase sigma factor [Firmicutes bacterium]|nr:sigma-70 family RNA polymerase sigma factor [Bacillota bacterium]